MIRMTGDSDLGAANGGAGASTQRNMEARAGFSDAPHFFGHVSEHFRASWVVIHLVNGQFRMRFDSGG